MKGPRLRMVAGPNGSGKTTLLTYLRQQYSFPLGHMQNPDDVDRELTETGRFDFAAVGLQVAQRDMAALLVRGEWAKALGRVRWSIDGNVLSVKGVKRGGYLAAAICDFVRGQWVKLGASFTFETVMSHPGKLRLLKEARANGYRTYLYFICTESARINHERVAVRVSEGGHTVPLKKIRARYERSLELLLGAIGICNRAYLFDNSGDVHRFVAEFEEGRMVVARENPPAWFIDHVLKGDGGR